MFEEKSGKDAIPPGYCSRRYQNQGVLLEVLDETVPVKIRPLTHFYNCRKGILFVHFLQNICAPFKLTFDIKPTDYDP